MDLEAGGMEMTKPRLATAAMLSVAAVTLAACGVGSSSHVVARLTPTTSVAPVSSTTAPGAAGSVPVSTVVGSSATTTPAALDPQTLDQVAADLGALNTSLNTANSDLTHPQGDS
jgi:negative regulator of sigma E activity